METSRGREAGRDLFRGLLPDMLGREKPESQAIEPHSSNFSTKPTRLVSLRNRYISAANATSRSTSKDEAVRATMITDTLRGVSRQLVLGTT
ncbi:hypothetical protein Pst134EA_031968 [Puccinia striiformis f. sp. tritici]|uniref:uncharacterized protein n=1 Tax=Puccinia striiformis f. sp. tritici TaxID=168172 RepID=UPI002008C628|nr:uncharacterized protein Pst134EA_031968 [Puccinia striiformis f. sp. tritici]KAH9442549.1 hypothetical protein Pst134EA_031968 [Puccinia striiformis f. sp. tritici]